MKYFFIFISLIFFSQRATSQQSVDQESSPIIEKDLQEALINEYEDLDFESVMHNAEEIRKINKAFKMFKQGEEYVIEDAKNPEKEREEKFSEELKIIQERSKIYLGSILFFSKNNWSIWINDKVISADNNSPLNEIYISAVNGKKADIIWSLSPSKWQILMDKSLEENDPLINKNNMITVKFSLQNNQSFLLKDNTVIEGKAVPKLSKVQ